MNREFTNSQYSYLVFNKVFDSIFQYYSSDVPVRVCVRVIDSCVVVVLV